MREFNQSEFKTALFAAKHARRQSADLRHRSVTNGSQSAQGRTEQRYIENVAASHLGTAGFDIDRFEKIREERQGKLRALGEEQKAKAIKYSSSAKGALRHGVDSRIKNLHLLPAPPKLELLNTPFLIWWTQGIDFPDIQYEALNSRAKFQLQSDGALTEDEMGFYYLWSNSSNAHAVINVDGYLIADGFCLARSEGGFWQGFRFSRVTIDARLKIFESLTQPPVEPLFQPSQVQNVVHVATSTGGFMDSDAVDYEHVYRGYDLQYQSLIVPPGESIVIEVTFAMLYGSDEGSTDIDFASGNFQVVSPAVLIGVLS